MQYSKADRIEAFGKIPERMREHILSESTAEAFVSMEEDFGLSNNELDALNELVTDVLLGLEPQQEFSQKAATQLTTRAERVVDAVDKEIFEPVQTLLDSYDVNRKTATTEVTQRAQKPATPPRFATAPIHTVPPRSRSDETALERNRAEPPEPEPKAETRPNERPLASNFLKERLKERERQQKTEDAQKLLSKKPEPEQASRQNNGQETNTARPGRTLPNSDLERGT